MIAQWIQDILSGLVAGGMDRTLWQTVIFWQMWLAKLHFDCSKQAPHSERASLLLDLPQNQVSTCQKLQLPSFEVTHLCNSQEIHGCRLTG